MKEYINALKAVFAQTYKVNLDKWSVGAETTNGNGQSVCEFKSEAGGITLQVTELGEKDGFAQFTAKLSDDDITNVSIPQKWKNLKFGKFA